MPENRIQSSTPGVDDPQGTPRVSTQPPIASEGPTPNIPPDKEAAPPQEERSFAGEDDVEGRIDPPRQPAPDRKADYGGGSMGHSLPRTDARTAGAAFADRMPEASATPAGEGDEPGTKKPPAT